MPSQYQNTGGRGGHGGSRSNKRKAETDVGPTSSSSAQTSAKKARCDVPRQNTAIYVTGLPLDAKVDEVHEVFSRRCGMIAEEIDSGKPRIKLYTDSDGNPKGDALIVFFKPESVSMAKSILDETPLRFGDSGPLMMINEADSSYKKTQYVEEGTATGEASTEAGDGAAGASDTSKPGPTQGSQPERKVRTEKEKQKIRRRAEQLQSKLEDWSDDEPYVAATRKATRWDKTVVLKHMFTLQELEDDVTAILDIKEDIREECEKIGDVKNVVLFDLEEEGVVSVKFAEAEAADACVGLMNGRNFGGQVVEASISTGKERFRKSKNKTDSDSDSEG